jgi:hypothetical protein
MTEHREWSIAGQLYCASVTAPTGLNLNKEACVQSAMIHRGRRRIRFRETASRQLAHGLFSGDEFPDKLIRLRLPLSGLVRISKSAARSHICHGTCS